MAQQRAWGSLGIIKQTLVKLFGQTYTGSQHREGVQEPQPPPP